jgi:hypothetical protein
VNLRGGKPLNPILAFGPSCLKMVSCWHRTNHIIKRREMAQPSEYSKIVGTKVGTLTIRSNNFKKLQQKEREINQNKYCKL